MHSSLDQQYLVYFQEDDSVARVADNNILEPPITKIKKGTECSVGVVRWHNLRGKDIGYW